MFTSLLSFLGGAAFRMAFGAIMSYFEKKQEHRYEVERMEIEARHEAERFDRQQEAITKQHELGIETIRVQGEQNVLAIETQGWANAVAQAQAKTGIYLVDLWNGVIRPSAASIALYLWVLALMAQNWKMGDWDKELVGMILGFFFASREMNKKGK